MDLLDKKSVSQDSVVASLTSLDFFASLSSHAIAGLAERSELSYYPPRKEICRAQGGLEKVFFVLSGRIKITIQEDSLSSETFLWELQAGDFFNDWVILADLKLPLKVVSQSAARLVFLPLESFQKTLCLYPGAASWLQSYTARLLYSLSERIMEFNLMGVSSRFHAELLRLAESYGKKVGDVVYIEGLPTHADMAARISTHREAVTRELKELEKMGLIAREGRTIKILDVSEIRRKLTKSLES